jgi:ankyrin repeat protein
MSSYELCKVIKDNDIEKVKSMLESGNCFLPNKYNHDPFLYAIINGNIDIMNLILSNKYFDFEKVYISDIRLCFCSGKLNMIKCITEKIISENFVSKFTPGEGVYIKLMQNINAKFETLVYLIDIFGIYISYFILKAAFKTKHEIFLNYILEKFKEYFLEINQEKNKILFLHACEDIHNLDNIHPKILNFLLPYMQINEIIDEENGLTYLFNCVKYGTIENVKFLIENGANIHHKDNKNRNLFFHMDSKDDGLLYMMTKKILYLYEKGVDLNSQDEEGNTFLMYVPSSRFDLITLIIALGVNPSIKNNNGYSYIEQIIKNNEYSTHDLLEYLIKTNLHLKTEIRKIARKYKKMETLNILDLLTGNSSLIEKVHHRELSETKATGLFVYVKLIEFDYFKLKSFIEKNSLFRFINILLKLPTEIQMMICCLSMDYRKIFISQNFINFIFERILYF